MRGLSVLDLFSAAAGGWSLGMHRAGFHTVAACEAVDWRRTLYSENNPGVPVYDDVCTLTADRLVRDLGSLPTIVVGSPPCQDISSANTKGKGVEGERSGLFFEAIRIIGEVRPRWFALENSANLRTRGADSVLSALEGIGYACWPVVVRASDIGANNERPRSWLIGCDLAQVADADGDGRPERWGGRRLGLHLSVSPHPSDATEVGCGSGLPRGRAGADPRAEQPACRHAAHAGQTEWRPPADQGGCGDGQARERQEGPDRHAEHAPSCDGHAAHADNQGEHASPEHAEVAELRGLERDSEPGTAPDADQAGQADGCLVACVRQEEIADHGCGAGRGDDGSGLGQVGLREADRVAALQHRADWSLDDLARHIRMDDGLPAWVAQQRIAVGGPRGTTAASLIVEAFGDAVVPQIPEAIGRAILRVEGALAAVYSQEAA